MTDASEGGRDEEAGRLVIVGEAGPEIFVPDGPGLILPAPETRKFLKGEKPGG